MQHPSLSPTHVRRTVGPEAMPLEEESAVVIAHVFERPAGNCESVVARSFIFFGEITERQNRLRTRMDVDWLRRIVEVLRGAVMEYAIRNVIPLDVIEV